MASLVLVADWRFVVSKLVRLSHFSVGAVLIAVALCCRHHPLKKKKKEKEKKTKQR